MRQLVQIIPQRRPSHKQVLWQTQDRSLPVINQLRPKIVSQGIADLEEMVQRVAKNTTYNSEEIYSILRLYVQETNAALQAGSRLWHARCSCRRRKKFTIHGFSSNGTNPNSPTITCPSGERIQSRYAAMAPRGSPAVYM